MRTRTLLTVTAILMLAFGVGFVLLPETVFSVYGVFLDPGGLMLARVAGAAILALGVLAWLARNSSVPEVNRVAVIALFCFFAVKSLVTLLAQLSGVFNGLGWSILAIDIPLALFYAAVVFRRQAASPASALR